MRMRCCRRAPAGSALPVMLCMITCAYALTPAAPGPGPALLRAVHLCKMPNLYACRATADGTLAAYLLCSQLCTSVCVAFYVRCYDPRAIQWRVDMTCMCWKQLEKEFLEATQ